MKRLCLLCAATALCLISAVCAAQSVPLPPDIGETLGAQYSEYGVLAADSALTEGEPRAYAALALTSESKDVLTVFQDKGGYALVAASETALRPGGGPLELKASDQGFIDTLYTGDTNGRPYGDRIQYRYHPDTGLTLYYAERLTLLPGEEWAMRSMLVLDDGDLVQVRSERQNSARQRITMAQTWLVDAHGAQAPDVRTADRWLAGALPEGPTYLLELPDEQRIRLASHADVYTGPGEDYLRLEEPLRALKAGDEVGLCGFEGSWALIRYASDDPVTGYFGYVPRICLPEGTQAPALELAYAPMEASKAYTVYDALFADGVYNGATALARVELGEEAELTYLFYLLEGNVCVELRREGEPPLRGFLNRTEL